MENERRTTMTTAAFDRSPSANADRSELKSTASEVHGAMLDAAGRDQEVTGKSDTQEIFEALLHSYANANNAGDSLAYSQLFAADAIWMPPGAEPECGPEQIRKSVQPYYDDATWSTRFTPANALRVAEEWIYGIAHVDVGMSLR